MRRGGRGLAQLVLALAVVVAVGDPLPSLRGRDLTGHGVTFPIATRGSVTLLALGFTYDSRFPVEAYVDSFRVAFAGEPRARAYSVPMIGGLGKLARTFIDGGMRRNSPRELHPYTVTVYDDVSKWKERLDHPGGDVAELILLDRRGRVAARHTGAYDRAASDSISARARRLLQAP